MCRALHSHFGWSHRKLQPGYAKNLPPKPPPTPKDAFPHWNVDQPLHELHAARQAYMDRRLAQAKAAVKAAKAAKAKAQEASGELQQVFYSSKLLDAWVQAVLLMLPCLAQLALMACVQTWRSCPTWL